MKTNKDNYGALAIAFLLMILLLSGCMTNRKGELTEKGKNFISLHCKGSDSTITVEKEKLVRHDSLIQLPADSSWYRLWLSCDSGKVIIKGSEVTPGKKIRPKFTLKDNILTSTCKTDTCKVALTWWSKNKETILKSLEKTVIQKPCDKEHKSGWDYFLIKTGIILGIFILVQILLKFLSSYPALVWLKIFYVFKF